MPAPHSEIPALQSKIVGLIGEDKYTEVAEAYAAFVKEHPTTTYMAAEPIPFKVADRLAKKYGSSATTTFTLRHTTWASDLAAALKSSPAEFGAFTAKIDAAVAEIAKTVKKVA